HTSARIPALRGRARAHALSCRGSQRYPTPTPFDCRGAQEPAEGLAGWCGARLYSEVTSRCKRLARRKMLVMGRSARLLIRHVAGVLLLVPPTAAASDVSEALRARATNELYSLDRDRAIETYRQAIAADPNDAAAYRGLATMLWLSITFRRGNMTVDDYLGRVSRQNVKFTPQPAD